MRLHPLNHSLNPRWQGILGRTYMATGDAAGRLDHRTPLTGAYTLSTARASGQDAPLRTTGGRGSLIQDARIRLIGPIP